MIPWDEAIFGHYFGILRFIWNILSKGTFEDDFPFPRVGYVIVSLGGYFILKFLAG